MDKAQALYSFWSGFTLPAYDENSVPDTAVMPYITYSTITDSFENVVNLSGSLYYKSMSWAAISKKAEEIADYITTGGKVIKLDSGYVWICRGVPFAQRMGEENDDTVRRIVINLQAEYLTEN